MWLPAEPTTGLDPVSRRRVWDAINVMKRERVVVLTTHNMEEADFLADTIMIMHHGQGKRKLIERSAGQKTGTDAARWC